jgi:hypothetical protein
MTKHGVTSLTTSKVLTGTRQAVSLHRKNAAEDEIGMTKICVTSSAAEMHVARSKKWHHEHERLEREQCEERDYDYYDPYYDQPHRQRSPEGGRSARGVKTFSNDLKRGC